MWTHSWLLLNLADQESAVVEPSIRKSGRALSGALPPPLFVADEAHLTDALGRRALP